MIETLIENVSLGSRGDLTSVGIQAGRFVLVDKSQTVNAKWRLDAEGCLMLPGMVDPHAHLDKSYTPSGPSSFDINTGATESALRNAISSMSAEKKTRSLKDIEKRAQRGIDRAISKGVCHLRSHLDLGQKSDLDVIELMLDVKNRNKDKIDIEYSLLCSLDTDVKRSLAKTAFDLGVDCIGGVPALTDNPNSSVDQVIAFAEKNNCPIDLHIDETEDPSSNCLEYLADRIVETSFSGPVLAGHCCSLAFQEPENKKRIIDKVAKAGIHVVTLPTCNLYLMGREAHPSPRGATPVNELLQAGVNVCAGSDNVQDPFNPWGDYEPLGTACVAAGVSHLNSQPPFDQPIAMVTNNAAKAMGLTNYGIKEGNTANFCLLRCTSLQQAISERSLRTWVFFHGRPVVKQTLEQVWIDPYASKTAFVNPL